MATDWLKLTQDAFDASSAYLDANYRPDWDYSLRAFRSEHATGSKYLSEEYKSRSRIFRPKTRSIIRKNEAAGAIALFSNMDVVNVTPGNADDPHNVASAACIKEVLEYRLSKTIPAFPLVMGALQDAQAQGIVCSYQYWDYQERKGKKVKDQPCIELRPVENIRLDGGASWLDPVGTSPYFCDIIPMYVCDVRAMMNSKDPKTGSPKWKKYDDKIIKAAQPDVMNALRQARIGNKEDPQDNNSKISEFDIVWVMRWFMKDSQSDDHVYYTLGTEKLLTDPKPRGEVYFHDIRPYVMGYAILETHKAIKTSLPMLIKPLQQETNAVANDRLDNVKFVLHKRWLVARGRQVDVQSLVRGVPGGVTLTTDPKSDVVESNWNDVTSSAYVEQDRLSADLDELAGNFSPSTKVANNAVNDTLGGSKMASQGAGLMTDYLLRTFIETWYEPVLRQLVMLEAEYETDEVVLQACANKARLFPRFQYTSITDDMLKADVGITVNVGMGSSDPKQRQQNFLSATQAVLKLQALSAQFPTFNITEASKEIYSNAGYRDGSRFINQKVDPKVQMLQQQVQKLSATLNQEQVKEQGRAQIEMAKIQSSERIEQGRMATDRGRISGDLKIRQGELAIQQAELAIEKERIELEKMKLQVEIHGASQEQQLKVAELGASLEQAQMKLEGERQKLAGQAMKLSAEIETAHLDLQTQREAAKNESRIGEVADNVSTSMKGVSEQIKNIKSELDSAKESIAGMTSMKDSVVQTGQAVALMLHDAATKKKPKGFKFKKEGGKTKGVVLEYHDGTSEEMPVE